MGVVYKAYDPTIGRHVAIKVVRIDASSTAEHVAAVDRLRIEAQAAGRCSHPAIIGIFDFLDQGGDPGIVMEYIEGRNLYGHLRDRDARAAINPVRLVCQILDPLAYAHRQGVIHRDIKPANILITQTGTLKIADFGIARMSGLNMTLTGATLGTPNYMAPEQLGSMPVDQRADLFAVGAILYELIAGRPPFAGQNTAETLARLAGPASADFDPIPASLRPVLVRALAKDRSQRFLTADEFAAALASDALGNPPPAMPDEQTILMPSSAIAAATLPKAWDPTLLRLAERELARFLGPMARLLVTRATQENTAPDALLTALAEHLSGPADRSQFLRAMTAARSEGGTGSAGSGSRSGSPGSSRGSGTPVTSAGTGAPSLGTQLRPGASGVSSGGGSGSSGGSSGAGGSNSAGGSGGSARGGGGTGRPFAGVSDEAATAAHAALVQHVGPIARVLVREAAGQATSARDFIDRLCTHVTKPEAQAMLRRRLAQEVEPKLG